jgi:hypothetical protein
MRRVLFWAGGLLLFAPMVWGQGDSKPANPAKAIIAEFDAARKLKKQVNVAEYAGRLLEVAKANPKSDAAGDAVIWILTVGPRTKEANAAVGLLVENHATSAALTPPVLDQVAFLPNPQMGKFLDRVAKSHPDSATREAAAAISKYTVGHVVPDITAEDTDGKEFKLSDYRGKVVLLDFWGHW